MVVLAHASLPATIVTQAATLVWVVPMAIALVVVTTVLALRLLGTRRGWSSGVVAGIIGWGTSAGISLGRAGDLPRDLRHIVRNSAIHLALKILDDFRAAFGPLLGRGDARAVLHFQNIGHGVFVGIGLLLGEAFLVLPALARAELGHAELIHHVLMVVIPLRNKGRL